MTGGANAAAGDTDPPSPPEANATPYVIGGSPAGDQWKNFVPRIITQSGGLCTGTFLSPEWVLTAGHCIESRATIYAGALTVGGLSSLGGASGIAHPYFDIAALRYDFGLYHLDTASSLGNNVVPLATYTDTWAWQAGTATTVLGWGRTVSGGPVSSQLMQGSATVADDATCTTLDQAIGQVFDPTTAMCIYTPGVSACNGDSGGPIYAINGAQMALVGLTSYGPATCAAQTVASWVPSSLTWLRSATGLALGGPPVTDNGLDVTRIFGLDRYETGSAVAALWDTADTVFVSTGVNFPDSLAAGAAAARMGAPLLLVSTTSIPLSTRFQLDRLQPTTIYVAGGPVAIADSVVAELAAATGASVIRLGGANRYATAELFTRLAWPGGASDRAIWVASGADFRDPLIASAAAAVYDEPFVLVNGQGGLDAASRALIQSLNPAFISVLGASDTISAALLADLQGIATVEQFNDPDASVRSAEVWSYMTSSTWVSLATSGAFPDALTATPFSALAPPSPLMLVPGTCVPAAVRTTITRLGTTNLALFGGPAALDPAVESLTPC